MPVLPQHTQWPKQRELGNLHIETYQTVELSLGSLDYLSMNV